MDELPRNNYTSLAPEARAMVGDAAAEDHRRLVTESEGLPDDIQRRLSRIRITQLLIALGGLIVLIALLSLVLHR